jgi:VIT1/CCC1 family predicted Fe2+/Mn2+ transporter
VSDQVKARWLGERGGSQLPAHPSAQEVPGSLVPPAVTLEPTVMSLYEISAKPEWRRLNGTEKQILSAFISSGMKSMTDVLAAFCSNVSAEKLVSMAAGEYVSVHSQADTEEAELELERAELKADDKGEHKELMAIYVARGLNPSLAKQVADQLMAHDAIGAHARDKLGISNTLRARPIQAALASAGSFAVGAAMPLLVTAMAPAAGLIPLVSGTSLVFLALLGGLAARTGGAGVAMGAMRVAFWGALAMAVTAGVGWLFGAVA